MELLRLQKQTGKIGDAEYEKQVQKFIEDTQNRWSKNNVSEAEKQRERLEIRNLIHRLPTNHQLPLIKQEYQAGIIGKSTYMDELTIAGYKIERDFNRSSKQSPPWYDFKSKDPVKEHEAGLAELRKAMADLSPEEQKRVIENIDWTLKHNS